MTMTLDRPRVAKSASKSKVARPKSARRWRVWARRFFITASLLLFLGIAGAAGAITWAWGSLELPAEKPLAQTTFITDANGDPLASFAAENRITVPLSQVPQHVQQAVLDTEDQDYFKHHGVDPRGITRALWRDLRNEGNLQGGSTITQQYVKKMYVGDDRNLERKFKEAILAMKLERKYSKEEILERYLNTIYFGRGAYGVQTASKAYFGKDVKDVSLQEGAYLAGLIRAPELAEAYAHPEAAKQRRDLTLGNMVRFGSISQEQADAAIAIPLQSYVIPRSAQQASIAHGDKGTQYFVEYVRNMLVQRYGEEKVLSGGLKIKTTLDMKMQTAAYDSVYGFLKPGEPAGALVTLGENGEIKAMVGGRDWAQSKVNMAVGGVGGGSGRQPGSTFKPLVLAAALEDGTSITDVYPAPGHMTIDTPGSDWKVSNYGGGGFGSVNLVEATVHSVNTVYAQLAEEEGPERMVEMAKALGITSELDPVHSLVLGAGEVSPLDMASAYLTFSQRGVYVKPNPIVEVKNEDGDYLERFKAERKRVMSQKNADFVTYALQQAMQRGTGTRAQFGKPAAGKTGTTEDSGDAWFVGYTPTLSTAVWMGYPEGATRKLRNVHGVGEVTGGTLPAQMWSSYMKKATVDLPSTAFEKVTLPVPTHVGPVDESTTTTTSSIPGETTSTTALPATTTTLPTPTTSTTIVLGDDPSGNGNGKGNGKGPVLTIPKPL